MRENDRGIFPLENSHILEQGPNPEKILVLHGPLEGKDGLLVLEAVKNGQVHDTMEAQPRLYRVFHYITAAFTRVHPSSPPWTYGIMRPRRRMSHLAWAATFQVQGQSIELK
jgi:hypothetical protein